MPDKLRISLNDSDSVSALCYRADAAKRIGISLVLGHGAGADQSSKFMVISSENLAARGVDTLTFNFLYAEHKRPAPDRNDKLEACWRAVISFIRQYRELAGNKLVIGGKSMGGRIGSQVAAQGAEGLEGLVFLGYPLHPPGKPDQLRSAHLSRITVPMLFIQGSRDSFGTSEELRAIINQLKLPATLYPIESGDHSFKVPKSSPSSQEQVYEGIFNQITEWLRGVVRR